MKRRNRKYRTGSWPALSASMWEARESFTVGRRSFLNISAYEYEVEDVFKRTGDRENGLLLKTGERRLLLFWDMLTFGKNYRVLYYKDITEVYQRFDKLFLEGLLFTVRSPAFLSELFFFMEYTGRSGHW